MNCYLSSDLHCKSGIVASSNCILVIEIRTFLVKYQSENAMLPSSSEVAAELPSAISLVATMASGSSRMAGSNPSLAICRGCYLDDVCTRGDGVQSF